MIALAMSDFLRASSAYIVIASKPMKEKQTTVAPVSTAGRCDAGVEQRLGGE